MLSAIVHTIRGITKVAVPSSPRLEVSRSRYIRGPQGQKAVIFIHGLFGDSVATWNNIDARKSWPELICNDPSFSGYDVYAVSFHSPFISKASTIEEIAVRVLQLLKDSKVFDSHDQLFFITHSMGGLIAKRMLVDLNRPNTAELACLDKVKAVLFISTPAHGATLAEIASWLSLNPQISNLKAATLNAFLQMLENSWTNLLRDRDSLPVQTPKSFSAYETLSEVAPEIRTV
jgi:triacylglycerol esterase/lipase EstA (alpha/beta hydrolase family)